MKKKICTETSIAERLQEFLDKEKMNLDVVTETDGAVEVMKCAEPKESNLDVIYAGGWITCEIARSMAKKINISFGQMGNLLNHLDVKIRHCSLGCFK
ncbi:MAG: hypothetical protein JW715_10180 [Sedimentisphaerales bacterium]|nr:hypothetical protein [Sedimentisphaerales bacterium]